MMSKYTTFSMAQMEAFLRARGVEPPRTGYDISGTSSNLIALAKGESSVVSNSTARWLPSLAAATGLTDPQMIAQEFVSHFEQPESGRTAVALASASGSADGAGVPAVGLVIGGVVLVVLVVVVGFALFGRKK